MKMSRFADAVLHNLFWRNLYKMTKQQFFYTKILCKMMTAEVSAAITVRR